MATSHGTYSLWNNKFDPAFPKTQWDDKEFICGEIKVKQNARTELCERHGDKHDEGCMQCKKHQIALAETPIGPKSCGKKWIGGTTCFNCLGADALKLLKPRKEYLDYNNYTGPIPQELKIFWAFKDAEYGDKKHSKLSVHDIITGMGFKIPKIAREPEVQRRVVRRKVEQPYMVGGWLKENY